ncbi:MAG: hypothetical protein K5905_03915 [Roseibium sp.]|uniref:hypothetical protein n=1 Tax=Roseibium sp. TaxID=1936156 RepID=UPI00260C4A4A|nr:hypothetical protein [Roseibium sp.]MCV0424597.1 hypothetical protein [Roseibium sp.]
MAKLTDEEFNQVNWLYEKARDFSTGSLPKLVYKNEFKTTAVISKVAKRIGSAINDANFDPKVISKGFDFPTNIICVIRP